jgi:ribosomal protein S18 acetylase RimI-like enzyme
MFLRRLNIAPYDPKRDEAVLGLFTEYGHKDYQLKVMGVAKARMAAYLARTLTAPGMNSICLRDNGKPLGLLGIQSLPWMSRHFGLRMYAVPHILAAASEGPVVHARLLRYVVEELSDVDFLDCRVAVDDVDATQALEICGFRYVGTEIYMGQELKPGPPPEHHPDFEIRLCEWEDREEVLDIVGETHVNNRFAHDPVIPESLSHSLYQRLVANCFDQKQFQVLVARTDGEVQGFIISKMNEAFSRVVGKWCGSLDFIGVRPHTRNRGLGAALNRFALHRMAQEGAEFTAVRTLAGNYAALGTCYRTGFKITATSLHFHRWVRRPARTVELEDPMHKSFDYSSHGAPA